jgi:uncharacterized integral membrane protein
MVSIVLAIILGIGFTIIASQNPSSIEFTVFDAAFTMPLYLFGALSFLLGIFVSAIFHIFDFISAISDTSSYEAQLKSAVKANENLQYQLQKTTEENVALHNELGTTKSALREQKVEHTKQNFRNFFGKIRHSLTS